MPSVEAEKEVRSVNRRCRGRFRLTDAEIHEVETKWDDCVQRGSFRDASLLVEATALRLGYRFASTPMPFGALQQILARMVYSLQDNCGYDVNNLILSNPLDGKDYFVTCPNCGAKISYTAPTLT